MFLAGDWLSPKTFTRTVMIDLKPLSAKKALAVLLYGFYLCPCQKLFIISSVNTANSAQLMQPGDFFITVSVEQLYFHLQQRVNTSMYHHVEVV